MSEQIDHIAELEKRLYARDPEAVPERKFGILRPLRQNTESAWGEKKLPPNTTTKHTNVSPYKKFFIVSFLFFLVGVGIAIFSIYRGAVTLSSKNVEVTILGNSFVAGGESLALQVDISNKNATALTNATLTLSYPRGASTLPGDVERIRQELGTIPSGKAKTQSFSLALYGEQGSTREVTATLEYKLEGSNAIFVREKTFSVVISTSPVSLVLDAPSTSASGQPFTITIRTAFTGDTVLDNNIVRVEYPNGYSFVNAVPAPSSGNNVWDLRDMVTGTERVIQIRGRLSGEEQDEKVFRVYVGERTSDTDARIRVALNSLLHSVVIAEPFMSARIKLGEVDQSVVTLSQGSRIEGQVEWRNPGVGEIVDPEFRLTLSGEGIVEDSIEALESFYDEQTRSLVWSSDTSTKLGELFPGNEGTLPFSFSVAPQNQIGNDISLSLSVKGIFPQEGNIEKSISLIDQKTVRFASRVQFSSQSLYSSGAFKNTGPYPPKVGKETSYTVVWTMRPTDAPLTRASAKAVLPDEVVWAGVISPQSEQVRFDSQAKTIVWDIGNVAKTTGSSAIRSVSFQIKVTPSSGSVGTTPTILGETQIDAFDTIAQAIITATRPALSTALLTDPLYSPGKEKVLP